MNRNLFLLVIPFLLTCRAWPAEPQGQLDASRTLFSVLAAINAAGYDVDLASAANDPLRQLVRDEIAKKKLPVVEDLKYFYSKHKRSSTTYDLSQYISFALSVSGPPKFENKFRQVELPPDVEGLQGFEELMVKFDKDANIEDLWKRSQPAFDRAIERYHEPVTKTILDVNAYLRNVTSGYLGRRFQIYIDLLGAPNHIQVRGYVDDYYIVLTPSPEPQIDDVRHAYLSYLIDPPGIKYSDLILKKRGLIDYVQNAPALPELYKADFLLLTTKSLIKAIESRLSKGNRQQMVDEALREGYILTPHFAEQLAIFEKQQESMRMYFPELIKSIDLKKEEKRLESVKFSEPRVRKARSAPAAPAPPPPSGATKTLEDAENSYRDRDLEKAKQLYSRVLQETEEKTMHASSYYGLARIAILQKDPELAERLFQKALGSSPEAQVRAWVNVYLGRLADAAGQRDEATKYYKEALAVEGGSAAARDAAQKGMQQSFQK